jgi:protein-S-isoprenylcysteine O-methyltransferase Ste14
MGKKKLIKLILEYLFKIFSAYVLYSSVLAIILFPMLLISGIFIFLFYYYDTSWILADPTLFFENKDIRTIWLNTYLNIPFAYSDLYSFIKISIFILGLALFIISLFQLVRGLKKDHTLVTHRIYNHIRHPQNLAIIIMAFPLFLYYGIRMGNVVSWVQFSFLMILYSDLGDIRLKKKYPEQFQSYYESTGFMTPKFLSYRITKWFSAITNKKVRYPLFLIFYILAIFILYQLYLVLPFIILHY